jgi:hypothetical protein
MVCPVESTAQYRNRSRLLTLNVRLFKSPTLVGSLQVPTAALVQFRTVDLNPRPDTTMICRHSAFRHHFNDVSKTEGISQVQSHNTKESRRLDSGATQMDWTVWLALNYVTSHLFPATEPI